VSLYIVVYCAINDVHSTFFQRLSLNIAPHSSIWQEFPLNAQVCKFNSVCHGLVSSKLFVRTQAQTCASQYIYASTCSFNFLSHRSASCGYGMVQLSALRCSKIGPPVRHCYTAYYRPRYLPCLALSAFGPELGVIGSLVAFTDFIRIGAVRR
jgi:hypothetical protein